MKRAYANCVMKFISIGHKCKKMSSNYLIVFVDEEEDTMEYNLYSENHTFDAL